MTRGFVSAPLKTQYESLNKFTMQKDTLTTAATTIACIENVFFRLNSIFRQNISKIPRYCISSKIFFKIPVKKFSFREVLGSKPANGQNKKFLTIPYAIVGVGK